MDESWSEILHHELSAPYFLELQNFVRQERILHEVYPSEENVFAALSLTSFDNTKVVILGQDPYHGPGQAHGLSFSVPSDISPPPSLRNIFTELKNDVGISAPSTGNLTNWAQQGVLLLNTTLTVRQGEAGSHQGHGWERLTDAIISALNNRSECCVFVLWGAHARKKKNLITSVHHVVIESAHPSPLSAHNGFFGSHPFSRINDALRACGHDPINWALL